MVGDPIKSLEIRVELSQLMIFLGACANAKMF